MDEISRSEDPFKELIILEILIDKQPELIAAKKSRILECLLGQLENSQCGDDALTTLFSTVISIQLNDDEALDTMEKLTSS